MSASDPIMDRPDERIDRLITLPFAKSLEISFKSLRVRFSGP